jgi:CCR4-NOT transcription complex subunit 2
VFPGQAGPYAGSYDGSGDAAAGTGNDVDRFGLIGLLSVIRMSDPDLTTLALGTDLTTLGLNLNSPEPLHKTFGSPWSDAPPRHELELQLPACYAVHTKRPNALAFSKFTPETLFYVFYSSPGDEARLFAADELAKRGWGFHKELKAWLTRVQGTEPVSKTVVGERGSFWIFDVSSWERVRKDNFNLQYDALEQPPSGGQEGKKTQDAGAAIGSQE